MAAKTGRKVNVPSHDRMERRCLVTCAAGVTTGALFGVDHQGRMIGPGSPIVNGTAAGPALRYQ
jgi:hypothetical protein